MSYNGWTTRETWLVNVWFNPESVDDVDAAEYVINEEYGKLPDFMRDFCNINSIDWKELRESFNENEDTY